MTWTAPPTVATSDIYTAAMFNTYTRDNTNHLRALTGNADPGAANKVVVSSGAATSAWGTVPDAALTNQKINRANASAASFAAAVGQTQFYTLAGPPDAPDSIGGDNWYCMTISDANSPSTFFVQFAFSASDVSRTFFRVVAAGVPSAWAKMWSRANDGAGSFLDADSVDGYNPGNGTNTIPISNGTVNTSLNADMVDGAHAGNSPGNVGVANSNVVSTLNADQVDGFHAGNSANQVGVSNGTLVTSLNADKLDGLDAGNASGNVPISNGVLNVNLAAASATMSGDSNALQGLQWPTPAEANATADTVTSATPGAWVDVDGLTFTAPRTGYYFVYYYLEINWFGVISPTATSPIIARVNANGTGSRPTSAHNYFAYAITNPSVHPHVQNSLGGVSPTFMMVQGFHVIQLTSGQVGKIQISAPTGSAGELGIESTTSFMSYGWCGQ